MKSFFTFMSGFIFAALIATAVFFAYKVYCPDARLPGEPCKVKCPCGDTHCKE